MNILIPLSNQDISLLEDPSTSVPSAPNLTHFETSSGPSPFPNTRAVAKLLGYHKYYTGRECKNSHLTYRYTQSGACADCSAGQAKGYRYYSAERLEKISKDRRDAIERQRYPNSEFGQARRDAIENQRLRKSPKAKRFEAVLAERERESEKAMLKLQELLDAMII